MIAGLLAPGSTPFSVALLVMVGLTAVELVSLLIGASLDDAVDAFVASGAGLESPVVDASALDPSVHPVDYVAAGEATSWLGRVLAWLYVGRVPVLMVLIVFLAGFGLLGLALQGLLRSLVGHALPALIAAPAVAVLSLPVVRMLVAGLARVLPRDETSAVDPRSFVGLTAVLVGGPASRNQGSQARLMDRHGTDHYVMVEPDEDAVRFDNGQRVLLVRDAGGGRFRAVENTSAALADD